MSYWPISRAEQDLFYDLERRLEWESLMERWTGLGASFLVASPAKKKN